MDAMAASREGEAKAPPPTAGSMATDNATRTAKNVRIMLMGSLRDVPQYPAGTARPSSDVFARSLAGLASCDRKQPVASSDELSSRAMIRISGVSY
jgi:hypothetical protein